MSLNLTRQDCNLIFRLVRGVASEPQEALETYLEMVKVYSDYGDDLPEKDREQYITSTFTRGVANYIYAGKASEEVFVESRSQLKLMFQRLKVPIHDLDEMADAAIARFWEFQYAEKYNPLKSAWSWYLYTALRRMTSTYWGKISRTPTATGFSYQQHEGCEGGEGRVLEPYAIDAELANPEACMALEELLDDFERFLMRFQTEEIEYDTAETDEHGNIVKIKVRGFPILNEEGVPTEVIPVEKRNGFVSNYSKLCILYPPKDGLNRKKAKWNGAKNLDVPEPVIAYFIRFGKKSSRVELKNGSSIRWDTHNISPRWANPDKTPREPQVVERSLVRLYKMLMQENAQADMVSSILKIGDSTVHAWVRTLERLFAEWWRMSSMIPWAEKWKADPQRVCRCCGWEHSEMPEMSTRWALREIILDRVHVKACEPSDSDSEQIEGHWCDVCTEGLMDNVPEKYILPFPWGRVRASQCLVDRSSKGPNSRPVQVYNL